MKCCGSNQVMETVPMMQGGCQRHCHRKQRCAEGEGVEAEAGGRYRIGDLMVPSGLPPW